MKKITIVKMALLLLLVLSIISIVFVILRNNYIERKKQILIEKVEEIIENNVEEKPIIQNGEIGLIIIPSIDVKAPICEGTSNDILKYSVGHFIETNIWNGNVALASHNGGSYAHYFSKINELKNGEEIIYITNMGERRYEVIENKIIKETNVNILGNTEENCLTLITCVTGEKSKRQCVIGKEIKIKGDNL